MSYKIRFYPELCVACGACSVACMDQNDILVQEGMQPFRHVYQTEYCDGAGKMHIGYYSAACEHCDDAPCIDACPVNCLSKDLQTGFTVFDTADCTGCGSCSGACPHNVPAIDANGKMVKCDGCNERVKAGYLPACVMVCPYDALKLEELQGR